MAELSQMMRAGQLNGRRAGSTGESLAEAAYRAIEEMIVTRQTAAGVDDLREPAQRAAGLRPHADPRGAAAAEVRGLRRDPPAARCRWSPRSTSSSSWSSSRCAGRWSAWSSGLARGARLDAERARCGAWRTRSVPPAATADAVRYLQATRAIHEAEACAAHNRCWRASIGVDPRPVAPVLVRPDRGHRRLPRRLGDPCRDAEGDRRRRCRRRRRARRLLDHLERLTRSALDRGGPR